MAEHPGRCHGAGAAARKAKHWHRSYVAKILANGAVVGTFTPHQRLTDAAGKRKRKPLEPVENWLAGCRSVSYLNV